MFNLWEHSHVTLKITDLFVLICFNIDDVGNHIKMYSRTIFV